VSEVPIDPAQRRLAERRLLAALRRHQRRAPLSADLRVDTLVAELRAAEPVRGTGHRGRQPLTLADPDLRRVVDELVASGAVLRRGHRVRLPDSGVGLDPIMRGRLDELLATLLSAGTTPPPAESAAARLGIPSALLDQLRASGELVSVAPRIDYPRDTWDAITRQLDELASTRSLSVGLVRDELGTARRHAEAILRHRARGQP
jgi:hypothetical protein